jgi:hypothetical protein
MIKAPIHSSLTFKLTGRRNKSGRWSSRFQLNIPEDPIFRFFVHPKNVFIQRARMATFPNLNDQPAHASKARVYG